jgi:hypothetical protein
MEWGVVIAGRGGPEALPDWCFHYEADDGLDIEMERRAPRGYEPAGRMAGDVWSLSLTLVL